MLPDRPRPNPAVLRRRLPTPVAAVVLVAVLLLLSGGSVARPVRSGRVEPAGGSVPVTFEETGLPAGTAWNVTMLGTTLSAAAGQNITFYASLGNYSYALGGPAGYRPTSGALTGTVRLTGAPNSVLVPDLRVGTYPSEVAYDARNGNLYVTNSGSSNVTVLNGTTDRVLVAGIPVGLGPFGIAFDPRNGYLYVANEPDGNVTVINGTTNTVVVRGIGVGSQPLAVLADPANGDVYVADAGANSLTVINGTTNTVAISSLPVGGGPSALALDSRSGELYVADARSNNVTVVDPATNRVVGGSISVGSGPDGLAYDSSDGRIYVTNDGSNNVTVVNGTTDRSVGTGISLGTGAAPAGIAYDSLNHDLYVSDGGPSNVTVIDGATDALVVPGVAVGSGPLGVTFDPANGYVYIAANGEGSADNVTILDGNGPWFVSWQRVSVYSLAFTESGLPTGTAWNVSLAGAVEAGAAGGAIVYSEPNGSYGYTIGARGWTAVPSAGVVPVDGANVTVAVSFALGFYPVVFTESALPASTPWNVTVLSSAGGSSGRASTGSTIAFNLPNGTYSFSVAAGGSHLPTPANGTLTVAGAPVNRTISFTFWTTVTFLVSGLPGGANWSVNLSSVPSGTSWHLRSAADSIPFEVPSNATYAYTIGGTSAARASNASGTVSVGAGPAIVRVSIPSGPTTGPAPAPSSGFPWAYLAVAIVAAIVGTGAALTLVRRRRSRRPPPPTSEGSPADGARGGAPPSGEGTESGFPPST